MELLEKDKEFLKEYEEQVLVMNIPPNKFIASATIFPTIIIILIILFYMFGATLERFFDVSITGQNLLNIILLNIIKICGVILVFFFCAFCFFDFIIYPIIHKKKTRIFYMKHSISKQEAERLYYTLSNVKFTCYLPILQRICRLNPEAKSTQIELINNWLPIDAESITEYVFNLEYSEEDWDDIVNQIKETDLVEKKKIVNKLFQLVILEDGIHTDEWMFMMQLIAQLQFNKHYVNYFKDRYESLRTEFDEYEKRGNSSENKYVYSLKEYYSTLGLEENATDEEIRRAYHELALQHHPDLPKNAGRIEECEKMMMKINEAYEKVKS